MPEVVRSIEIQAPPSAVWQWFTTVDALRKWLSPNLEIDLKVGGAYRMLGADGETWISGTVLELEEGAGWTSPARLVITLQATATGTRVTLTHDGFAGIGSARWPEIVNAYERGADRHQVLQQLAGLVAGGGA